MKYKVLIMSDSHGLKKELLEIKQRHTFDAIIHCGDSELDFNAPELDGIYKVGGNCDFDPDYPEDQVLEIGDIRFYITHGHLHQVKTNLLRLSYRAEEVGASIICFGHTHIAGAEKIGNRLFLNPGSVRLPRNRPEATYAILEWEMKEDIHITFYSTQGEIVEPLSKQVKWNS
ncbi:metallophosphoesterase [Oceanobacillus piezotolerans]|uniref:Phosphoesterase n=1 Tax=Oceanobacillus piezotolerans TaxID=2448030 RepID=A0A498DCH7_9BACI|nr:metallophosphoesterase [Oceanobacillus piezotolerans]RLL47942.1 metallophosphoesterase [Oceanobacillus piezotolerans]